MTHITREQLEKINDALPDDLGVQHIVALCNAAIDHYIEQSVSELTGTAYKMPDLSAELPEPYVWGVPGYGDVGYYTRDQLLSALAARDAKIADLEKLCDETYVAQGADAYNYACECMEQYQQKRHAAGKEVGTIGSLCDGIAWLYDYVDTLEARDTKWQGFELDYLAKCKELDILQAERDEQRKYKDGAYLERNQLVALLSKVFRSGKAKTAIEGWDEAWHGCVYIDLPTGQASWHYHESQAYLYDHLPEYTKGWDGHTTEEKYERIAAVEVLG